MSLLKRIENARPGMGPGAMPGVPIPAAPGVPPSPGGAPPAMPQSQRLASQAPVRESFRDV
jgi:hypothetical protein